MATFDVVLTSGLRSTSCVRSAWTCCTDSVSLWLAWGAGRALHNPCAAGAVARQMTAARSPGGQVLDF